MITQLRIRSALALALSLFAFGCPEEGGDGGGGAGGGGGGDTSCNGVCSALLSQHCFYAGGMDDCLTSCNGWDAQYASGADYCVQAWDDYKSCITSESLVCPEDYDAHWDTIECRGHWDHVQNYCVNMNAMPSTLCMPDNAVFDTFCTSTPATPHGKSCFGDAPANCVVGGTENNSNLYCCP